MKLNLGCGKSKLKDCINIDVEASCEPDLVLDFINNPLPYPDDSVDRVYLFHVIEHIPEARHAQFLTEIRRVLNDGGKLIISYPEFRRCASNWVSNYRGQRDFWKATIYGLQRYPSDFHVALMDTEDFERLLDMIGLDVEESKPETHEPWNTIVICAKGIPKPTYETVLNREIFGR